MKNIFLAASLAMLCNTLFAQIEVIESQIIEIGDSVIRHTDTIPNITGFSDTGADLYWDFTGALKHISATTNTLDPASTPYAADFPGSNLCMTNDSVNYLFFQTSPSSNYTMGLSGDLLGSGDILVVEQTPPSLLYDFPLKYQKTFNGAYKISEKASGASISPLIDSVWLKRESTHFDSIEAYGKVKTDYGIFKAIKNKRVENSIDTILTKSLFGWSQFDIIYTTTTTYYWHTREGKLPVAEYLVQDNGGDLIITEAVPEPIANFVYEGACAGVAVQFTDSSIQNPTSWLWDFGDGNTSTDQNPRHTYSGAGSFTVRLIVNRNYPDTLEKVLTIHSLTANAGSDQDICPGESASLSASGGTTYAWSHSAGNTASINVSPTTSTTYTVTVTDANNCRDTDQVLVNVLSAPRPALFDAVICSGGSTILDAGNNESTYLWSTSDTTKTITVSSAGTYYVSITAPSSLCTIIDTAEVSTGANLSVPLTNTAGCDGDTVILNAGNPGATYAWSTGETSQTISVTTADTFAVTVTDQACTGTGSSAVSFNPNPSVEITGDTSLCENESTYLFANTNAQNTITWSGGAGSNDTLLFDPQGASQIVEVTVEDNNACTASDQVFINVNPLPQATISGDTEICAGELASLTAAGGSDYLWSDNSNTVSIEVSPSTSTNYSVTVSNSFGCTDIAQQNLQVNALPNNVQFAFEDTLVCIESDIDTLYLAANPAGGIYSGNAVENNYVLLQNINAFTTVYYTYTNNSGCSASDSINVAYEVCSGIETLAFGIDYQVYPNPSSNGFYFKRKTLGEQMTISLIDLNGKTLNTVSSTASEIFFSTENIAEGLYFLIGRDQTGKLMMETKIQVLR